jgi:hypothetical protein
LNLNSQRPTDTRLSENTISKRVQNRVHNSEIDPDLEQLISVWPKLPEHIKTAIMALIQTHKAEKK